MIVRHGIVCEAQVLHSHRRIEPSGALLGLRRSEDLAGGQLFEEIRER